MAKRKPRVEYKWRRVPNDGPPHYQCTWSLYGGNGEYMCGSGNETYWGKNDARRAVENSVQALTGLTIDWAEPQNFRETGPGKKPQH